MDLLTSLSPGEALFVAAAGLVAAAGVAAHALRTSGPHRGVRVAAGLVAVLSLVGLALQPARRVPVAPSAALLVTPGADAARVEALADSLRPAHRFVLPGAAGAGTPLPDLAALRRHPGVTTLHVAGLGLAPEEAEAAEGFDVVFHPAPPPPGVAEVGWTQAVGIGRPLRVRGTVAAPAGSRLVLLAPGGVVDSTELDADRATFALADVPADTGAASYVLRLRTPGGKTVAETLGVHVRPPDTLRVLVLRGAPDFETRHLADFLGETGAAVAVRTTVSRDRDRTSFINRPPVDLRRLTPDLLAGTDLVSADARALDALPSTERRALEAAIRDGLGLLLTPDAARAQARSTDPFADGLIARPPLPEAPSRTARIVLPDAAGEPVPVEAAVLGAGRGVRPLVRDEAGETVVAVRTSGLGRVGLALPRETFRWRLGGDEAAYAAYWSALVSALARSAPEADRWRLAGGGPVRVDRPVDVVLETVRPRPVGIVRTPEHPDTLFLEQDPLVPERWTGRYWPRRAGWHRVAAPGGEALRFYVSAGGAWSAEDAAERHRTTHALAARAPRATAGAPETRPEPVPPLLFFLLFVAATAVLWGAERR